jgi:phosphoribosylformylglycinamidine synthase subunit PurS
VKAMVVVRPKDGILDPQGDAVRHSLRKLGFEVSSARIGRVVDIELAGDDREEAQAQV